MKKSLSFWCICIPSPVLSSSFLFFHAINNKELSIGFSPIIYPVMDFKTNALSMHGIQLYIPSSQKYPLYHKHNYIFSLLFTEVIVIVFFLIYIVLSSCISSLMSPILINPTSFSEDC